MAEQNGFRRVVFVACWLSHVVCSSPTTLLPMVLFFFFFKVSIASLEALSKECAKNSSVTYPFELSAVESNFLVYERVLSFWSYFGPILLLRLLLHHG